MSKPLASIIILNYNGKKYLRDCLEAVLNQNYQNKEIILVDNGSGDGSVEFIRENFPVVKLIANKRNLGFAQGNNQGLALAGGEYIIALNNDTVVDQNWLSGLIADVQKDQRIGLVASKIFSAANPKEIDSAGVNVCLDGMARGRGRLELDTGQYEKIEEILLPSACAALYRREMLEEVGFFDEDFFAYCEDTDLGLRARLAGWRAVLAPKAKVWHRYSATSGQYSPLKAFLVERNHLWVVLKNFPLRLVLLFPVFTFYRLCLQVLAILTGRGAAGEFLKQISFGRAGKIFLRAYGEALKKLPKFIKKRRTIQRNRKISTKEFLTLLKKHRLSFKELVFKK